VQWHLQPLFPPSLNPPAKRRQSYQEFALVLVQQRVQLLVMVLVLLLGLGLALHWVLVPAMARMLLLGGACWHKQLR
jgi:hypothetical protein